MVVSSQAMLTRSASTRRRFTPCPAAVATASAARPGTETVIVSKKSGVVTASPSPSARVAAIRWACDAMPRSPSGPW